MNASHGLTRRGLIGTAGVGAVAVGAPVSLMSISPCLVLPSHGTGRPCVHVPTATDHTKKPPVPWRGTAEERA